jgi:hypothetical protein
VGALHEVEADAGVERPEVAQEPGDRRGAQRGQEREAHAAVQLVGVAPDLPDGHGDLAQRPLRVPQEGAALPGEAHRATGPDEQPDAEVGLQPGDAAAERRLRDTDLLRRMGHVLGPRDGDELAQPGRDGEGADLIHNCIMA